MSARPCTGPDYRRAAQRQAWFARTAGQANAQPRLRGPFARCLRRRWRRADRRCAITGKPMARLDISSTAFASMAAKMNFVCDAAAKSGVSPSQAARHSIAAAARGNEASDTCELWRLRPRRLQHHDAGANRGLLIKIHRILVNHANAARRLARSDRPGLIGAMDSKIGIAVPLPKI